MRHRWAQPPSDLAGALQDKEDLPMKTLSTIAIAATLAGVASACTVRTETVERPAPVATVATTPAPGTVVYTDPAPTTTTTTRTTALPW
jgi:hypothetical protein